MKNSVTLLTSLLTLSLFGLARIAEADTNQIKASAAPEFVGALSATAIDETSATLGAVIIPHSAETSVAFRLGIDLYYTLPVNPTPSLAAGELPVTVTRTVTGLIPGKTYYYTAKAVSSEGSTVAEGFTFTTKRTPVAVADTISVRSNAVRFDPLKNDSDPDGAGLKIVKFTQGAHGRVEFGTDVPAQSASFNIPDGPLVYTPNLASPGNDSFSYTLRGGSSTTVTVKDLSRAVPELLFNNGQPLTFDPLENEKAAGFNNLLFLNSTQGVHGKVLLSANGLITYLPASGIAHDDQFTYTLSDQSIGLVTLLTAPITYQAGLDNSQQVPGESADTFFGNFGIPAAGPFSGTLRSGTNPPVKAIFAADGSVLLKEGGNAPMIEGARIGKLGAPSGHALLVTLAPQRSVITAANSTVLYTGLASGNLKAAVRTGSSVPELDGVFFRSILAFDGNGSSVFFLATVVGKKVNHSNDVVLCAVLEDGSVRVLAGKGWGVTNSPITVLSTLVGAQGSLAEGRWRLDDHTIGVRITMADKTEALFSIPDSAVKTSDWRRMASSITVSLTEPPYTGLTITSFELPAVGTTGASCLVNLPVRSSGFTKHNVPLKPTLDSKATNAAILNIPLVGPVTLLARKGHPVTTLDGTTLPGLTFKSFFNPVRGAHGHAAFLATFAGTGVNAKNNTGLFIGADRSAAKMIARTGDAAHGGGIWSRFTSLVLPDRDGVDAVFTATLESISPEKGARLPTTTPLSNNLGLWISMNGEAPRLVLRSGQQFFVKNAMKIIRTFTAIAPSPGSIGAASGYDNSGSIRVLATFDDGTELFIEIALPKPPIVNLLLPLIPMTCADLMEEQGGSL